MHELGKDYPNRVIVTYSETEARLLYEDYRCYDRQVFLYPARDLLFYNADIKGNELTAQRIRVLKEMLTSPSWTVIVTADGCLEKLEPLPVWDSQKITIDLETEIEDMDAFIRRLVELGYERQVQAELPGQFALRGGILDIFPLTEENPVRIELWDTAVDSIRLYDAVSQRSLDAVERVVIFPAVQEISGVKTAPGRDVPGSRTASGSKALSGKKQPVGNKAHGEKTEGGKSSPERLVSFLDYIGEDTILYIDEPARVEEMAEAVVSEFQESMLGRQESGFEEGEKVPEMFEFRDLKPYLERKNTVLISGLDRKAGHFFVRRSLSLAVKSVASYQNGFEMLVKDLLTWKKEKYRVVLLCASRTRAERLAADLRDTYELRSFFREKEDKDIQPGEILVTVGSLHRGFEYPSIRLIVITETDMFGGAKKKRRGHSTSEGKGIRDYTELSPGDYVVHENHGLGIYRGIEKIEVDQIEKDYIKVEYGDGGNLYLPVTQMNLLQKYADADAPRPKLNRLNSAEWTKTKTRVKGAVRDIAKDLVKLYARRQNAKGYVYPPDDAEQREFEEYFPYELTEDQEKAIGAVKEDMESGKIMDRLICGDVGYGKTEIAIRAAFKAVQEGQQVAYLVPTTILAQQHYNTFCQRMANSAVSVDLLCRFRTPAQQKDTLARLKDGRVDIIIGTHRLLSKDVEYHKLGMLIIDEEQRFGVAHKEKIKKMKETVDVLTLTATPIPRTLHMSLVGIRDMSVLREAPVDRRPIQTYVMEYHDELVREAIRRELARGGQVFYVNNRVHNILDVTSRIQSLVPEATVACAHGQMTERQLENIMLDFINGDIQVLVSTTIIETGLDIPNVNTIIIQDADRFGLSQLYQLRGRVGRSSRTAYAFLMYKKDKLLREEAEKRLSAIRQYTELGSGIRIAMRDLEIRGAGNVLGEEQHGHMEAVGYDLYCKLLREAVLEEKGEKPEKDFETEVDFPVNAFIPSTYIRNEALRLDIYKRISSFENEDDLVDMQDELIDRFGDPPKPVQVLLQVAVVKALAHKAGIESITANERELRFFYTPSAQVDTEKVPEMIKKYRGALKYASGKTPGFLYTNRQGGTDAGLSQVKKAKELLQNDLLPLTLA